MSNIYYENYVLTLEEASNQLKISKSSIYKLLRNNQLKGFKIGRNWKIPQTAIYEYIEININNSSR